MSRTKRNYLKSKASENFDKTQEGLGYIYPTDPRDKYTHGYDGLNPSYYYYSYPSRGWKENFQTKTRKNVKRKFAKARRKAAKQSMHTLY